MNHDDDDDVEFHFHTKMSLDFSVTIYLKLATIVNPIIIVVWVYK